MTHIHNICQHNTEFSRQHWIHPRAPNSRWNYRVTDQRKVSLSTVGYFASVIFSIFLQQRVLQSDVCVGSLQSVRNVVWPTGLGGGDQHKVTKIWHPSSEPSQLRTSVLIWRVQKTIGEEGRGFLFELFWPRPDISAAVRFWQRQQMSSADLSRSVSTLRRWRLGDICPIRRPKWRSLRRWAQIPNRQVDSSQGCSRRLQVTSLFRCNRTKQRPGPDNDHTIWSLCGPEFPGPDNDHLGLDNDQSLCGPRHIFRTRQWPSPVVVTQS